tara:strand:- start:12563 stop:12778 length:216 start_codon:yes stop_codon:yes gene_type:complete
MNNGQTTTAFFTAAGGEMTDEILTAIAKHYEITNIEVIEEVTGDEAEFLCDYLVEPTRSLVFAAMKRRNFA